MGDRRAVAGAHARHAPRHSAVFHRTDPIILGVLLAMCGEGQPRPILTYRQFSCIVSGFRMCWVQGFYTRWAMPPVRP
jgi:hypothetical protein